ncbi:MAG: Nitroreductase [Microgenomates group bacterium GW2011_GWA2_47_8]|nr:MAG: Nitroreductase [Microgenomates group bacterium GW2011_GWA2_47_8]
MLKTNRSSTYPINQIILNRWSPRAMTGKLIDNAILMSFFEAARWGPSSMNNQLTRFVYAKKDTPHWQKYFELLNEGNREWCADAAVLVIVISRKISYHKDLPQRSHALEAGACMQNLMLEATSRGYVAHAMGGFDKEKAHTMLGLHEVWSVEVMIAVGEYDAEKSKEKEEKASDRKPLSELAFEGVLPENFE